MARAILSLLVAMFVLAAALLTSAAPAALERRADALSGFTTSCSKSGDPLTLKALTFTPSPVVPGKPLNFTLTGDLSKPITAGASIAVKATILGFITVLSTTVDLCSAQGVTCPIAAGNNQVVSFSFNIPSSAPSGLSVAATATATNGDGSEIICVSNPSLVV
ncbi:ML domain-containing protein [Zopfochytrium polystomum]|nr:ML domain-containing protein [Zopfochytrium polystomum]